MLRQRGVWQGAGWGGPSKGARFKAAKAPVFKPTNRAAARLNDKRRSARRQELLVVLFDLAFTAELQEVQVSAAAAWLNRVEGKPVAYTSNPVE